MKKPANKCENRLNCTGMAPLSDSESLRFRHVNVVKIKRARTVRVMHKMLQNIGMPVEVRIDIATHRFYLCFETPNLGKGQDEIVAKLFDLLGFSHKDTM
jgi:hypothetical protein